MSAIGGIAMLGSGQGDPRLVAETLTRLDEVLARTGPDGGFLHAGARVGMAFRLFQTTPGPAPAPAAGELVLTFDGRLDNRAQLIDLLDPPSQARTDADLVLAAYRTWDVDFVEQLLGDFALALFDGRAQRLILARDAFGARPLFYHHGGDRLVWASDLRALLRLTFVPVQVNEAFVAGTMAYEAAPEDTPYRDIFAVPFGHLLVVADGRVERRRHWRPPLERARPSESPLELEERFRATFEEAVATRLRASGPVTAELSGGLDSSSIVCLAHALIRQGRVEASDLAALAYVFDEATDSDERPWIRAVEKKLGLDAVYIREDDHRLFPPIDDEVFLPFPSAHYIFLRRQQHVLATMSGLGSRVLLSGLGGDQVAGGDIRLPLELADLIRHGRLGEAHTRSLAWSRALNRPFLPLLWKNGICPLLPPPVRARVDHQRNATDWLDRDFARRTRVSQRRFPVWGPEAPRDPSLREQWARIVDLATHFSMGFQLANGFVEMSYPFLHRPLVELCLTVPPELLLRPGETRSLHRRALAPWLPPEVALRRDKKGPNEAILRGVVRAWPQLDALFARPLLAEHGFFDLGRFKDVLREAKAGRVANVPMFMRTVCLEIWLRALARYQRGREAPLVPAASQTVARLLAEGWISDLPASPPFSGEPAETLRRGGELNGERDLRVPRDRGARLG